MKHIPVLVKEVLANLAPKTNQNFVDCTLGLGGHTQAILERTAPKGKILAIEQDPEGFSKSKKILQKFKNRVIFKNDNFKNLTQIIKNENFTDISGIFFDLGLASWQIETGGKGISFQTDEPLNMRLGQDSTETAADILNHYSQKQLANLFYQYGDIRRSYQLAEKIMYARQEQSIETTFDLIRIINNTNPKILAPIFQALRIEVNHELENLSQVLPQTIEVLKLKGRIVVISYHSGEDRMVKNFFRSRKGELKILTKKPITASWEEIKQNPRSRSAKLRAAEII